MSRSRKSKARKVIYIDPMKPVGIQKAIAELKREQRKWENDKAVNEFMDKVAQDMVTTIYVRQLRVADSGRNYDFMVPHYERDGFNRTIKQSGKQIAFLEFGAGAEASNGLYLNLGFYPGSWSEHNAKTYQAWVDSGYQGVYRYEQKPARGYDTAIADLHDIVKNAADKVFGGK